MTRGIRRIETRIGAASVLVAGLALAPPTRLQHADASSIQGREYTAEFNQSVEIVVTNGSVEVERYARLRGRFEQSSVAGDSVRTSLRLDSARAHAIQHGQRQILDARQLPGTATALSYARHGGRPAWGAGLQTIGFGAMVPDAVPLALLLDPLFVPMPDRPVDAGDTWEADWTLYAFDAREHGPKTVRARFRLELMDSRGRSRVARIAISSSDGTATISGHAIMGIDDGVVHEVSLKTTGSGTLSMGPESFPFNQTSSFTLMLVPNGRS